MKTQKFSLTRTILPTALCCILALPIIGYSGASTAADKKPSIPNMIELAIQSVNINKADAKTLAQVLKGVGEKKAEAIVSWREQNGSFTNVSQLLKVKGIGEKTLVDNRSRIKL